MGQEKFKQIGEKIHVIRITTKLTQEQMAGKLNISRVQYSRIEKGTAVPNANTLYQISEQFGISLDWLVMDKGTMDLQPPDRKWVSMDFGEDKEAMDIMLEKMYKAPVLRYAVLNFFIKYYREHQDMLDKTENEYSQYKQASRLYADLLKKPMK
jgi:transcriptional regulator with XRE-family HTH domain